MPERYRVVSSGPLSYLLSVPQDVRPAGALLPVLCFLHGYGEAAPRDIRRALTLHGPLKPTSSPRATRQFIVVAPQLRVAGDIWLNYADALRDIVAQVNAEHGGDPRRSYLTGFSFGANGVLDLGARQPLVWAALWAVDPTRLPAKGARPPVWVSLGDISRARREVFASALEVRAADRELAGDCYYSDDGEDHAGTATLAYKDERIYRWLLSKASSGG